MEGRRVPKPLKVALLVVAALFVLAGALGVIWWTAISKLSRETPALFAAEIEAAARDSLIGPADVELLNELHAISVSKEASVTGRSLCVGVGTAPLLRRSISDEDRRDLILVRDFLQRSGGRPSTRETSSFLLANPRIQETFRTYGSAVKEAVARRRGAGTP